MSKTAQPKGVTNRAKVQAAIKRYLDVVGDGAMMPDESMSTVQHNGTVTLQNVRGFLAIVTSTSKVFDRVGGNRLDEVDSRSATQKTTRTAQHIPLPQMEAFGNTKQRGAAK
jgi:alpha-tubulin suppressor-like RCC1 family protein